MHVSISILLLFLICIECIFSESDLNGRLQLSQFLDEHNISKSTFSMDDTISNENVRNILETLKSHKFDYSAFWDITDKQKGQKYFPKKYMYFSTHVFIYSFGFT